jgi:hypothetical protein
MRHVEQGDIPRELAEESAGVCASIVADGLLEQHDTWVTRANALVHEIHVIEATALGIVLGIVRAGEKALGSKRE